MIKHDYESTFIIRAESDEDEVARLRARIQDVIESREGQMMVFEDWGKRKLAFQIEKADHGRYLFFHHVSPASVPSELERIVRIEFNIVRYLTIRVAENADFDEQVPYAIAAHKRRVARASSADDERRLDRRGRRPTSGDRIKSPSPERFELAGGEVGGTEVTEDDSDAASVSDTDDSSESSD
jgi:small subunit ribosomal protein S6